MGKNRYPHDCQQLIAEYRPVAAAWASAAVEPLDDIRQLIATAWCSGEDPAVAVPRALGLRRIGDRWISNNPAVYGGEIVDEVFDGEDRLLPFRDARGGLTRGIANDEGIGLRAAQKRLKKARERAAQGDLFGEGEL